MSGLPIVSVEKKEEFDCYEILLKKVHSENRMKNWKYCIENWKEGISTSADEGKMIFCNAINNRELFTTILRAGSIGIDVIDEHA